MKIEKKIAKKIPRLAKIQKKQPGLERKMHPKPQIKIANYSNFQKLKNKVAIITGGDSGIGHATALLFAKEGADIVIAYLDEHEDAKRVQEEILLLGKKCLLISGDLAKEKNCNKVVNKTIKTFGKVDILVNNVAEQYPKKNVVNISRQQLYQTFETNIFSYFYMIQAAMPYLKKGSAIINTTSITAYQGSERLMDYSATKGGIVALTRSLSQALVKKGIRVNAVAPGPIWTPLIEASFSKEDIKKFGKNVPMKRPGQPNEVAPSFLFLASDDSAYMTGQVLHPNGGVIVNG